ncbi:MAG: HD domain-containing protein [Candidatus Micrarchaeia archaeon]
MGVNKTIRREGVRPELPTHGARPLVDKLPLEKIIEAFRAHGGKRGIKLIRKAYAFAKEKHRDEWREDGSPFISHPEFVALRVAEIGGSAEQVSAALLHDIMENQGVGFGELRRKFGEKVARIVVQLSKPKYTGQGWIFASHPRYSRVENKAAYKERSDVYYASLLKSDAFEAIPVKIFDSLHNLLTMQSVPQRERKRRLDVFEEHIAWLTQRLDPSTYNLIAEQFRALGRDVPSVSTVPEVKGNPITELPPRAWLTEQDLAKLPLPSIGISVYAELNHLLVTDRLEIGLPNPRLLAGKTFLEELRAFFPDKEITEGKSLLPPGMAASEQIYVVKGFRPPEAGALISLREAIAEIRDSSGDEPACIPINRIHRYILVEPLSEYRQKTLESYKDFVRRLMVFFDEHVRPHTDPQAHF